MKQERKPKYEDRTTGFPRRLYDLLGGENPDRGAYAKLARAINKSTAVVSNYVSGATGASSDTIVGIAKHFSVSTDYLLGLSDDPSTDESIRKLREEIGLTGKSISALQSMCEASGRSPAMKKTLDFINRALEEYADCSSLFLEMDTIFSNLEDYVRGSGETGFTTIGTTRVENDEIFRSIALDRVMRDLSAITDSIGDVFMTKSKNNAIVLREYEEKMHEAGIDFVQRSRPVNRPGTAQDRP